VLYFVCRTYQRFTKAGVCTCHSIREQTVTEAVQEKVREICAEYLNPQELFRDAKDAVEQAAKKEHLSAEIAELQRKRGTLTAHLDRMYVDRLNGILSEEDFERIYNRTKQERTLLDEQLQELEGRKKSPVRSEDRAKELVKRYMDSAFASRELLVSMIERIELTENKEIIIRFRFRELEQPATQV